MHRKVPKPVVSSVDACSAMKYDENDWRHRRSAVHTYMSSKYLLLVAGPALPLGELGGFLGHWAKGAPKIKLRGLISDERTPKREW